MNLRKDHLLTGYKLQNSRYPGALMWVQNPSTTNGKRCASLGYQVSREWGKREMNFDPFGWRLNSDIGESIFISLLFFCGFSPVVCYGLLYFFVDMPSKVVLVFHGPFVARKRCQEVPRFAYFLMLLVMLYESVMLGTQKYLAKVWRCQRMLNCAKGTWGFGISLAKWIHQWSLTTFACWDEVLITSQHEEAYRMLLFFESELETGIAITIPVTFGTPWKSWRRLPFGVFGSVCFVVASQVQQGRKRVM